MLHNTGCSSTLETDPRGARSDCFYSRICLVLLVLMDSSPKHRQVLGKLSNRKLSWLDSTYGKFLLLWSSGCLTRRYASRSRQWAFAVITRAVQVVVCISVCPIPPRVASSRL